jgi:sugar phosphate isomerase/epimerase
MDNILKAKKLGFQNIEFNMRTVEQGDEKLVYKVKKILETNQIKCLSLHAATFPVTDEIEIPKAVYFGKVSASFANILSASIMVIHSNVSRKVPESQHKKLLHLIFKEIKSHAKDLNVSLSLENLSDPSKSIGKDLVEMEQVLNVVDDGNMGITIDFCHGETTGQTLNLFEKYKNKLSNVHVSNRKHGPIEHETPNLKDFLMKLRDFGYADH